MARICPLMGPKASAFCMVVSAWGVVFLGLLGLFFATQAVTLFPDLHFGGKEEAGPLPNEVIEDKYSEKATQCWVAAGMYAVTLVLVFWQNRWNTQGVF